MGKKKVAPAEAVRITVDMPRPLWRAVKVRCMDDRKSFQGLVRELLAEYLRKGDAK
jgi:hypothetical protein